METAELKMELLDKIEQADESQIKELYGLIVDYFNGIEVIEEWDVLPVAHREMIEIGLNQAEAGLGTPLDEVISKLKSKYGLND